MKKRILSVVLVCAMLVSALSVFASANNDTVLQFGEDGKFQIMLFADVQDEYPLEETTIQLMCESLDKYQPDLAVFLGDNTVAEGHEAQYNTIKEMVKPLNDRNVPYAIVFGNHDQEQGVTKEELLEYYQEFGCLTYDADPDLYGCGNSNLTILSSDGAKVAFNLWFIDSNSSNPDREVGGYDYVHEDQIEWYKNTAAELKEANGGEVVPSLLFQHIIFPEVYEVLYPKLPITIGKDFTINGTTYIPLPGLDTHSGVVFEPCCPPYNSVGQFDAIVETGDVLASFHGHDHTNDFVATCEGVDIVSVPTVGCNSYSTDLTRGVGLITLDESDLTTYEYETVYLYDMAMEDGSLIPDVDGGESTAYYFIVKYFREFLDILHETFGAIFNFATPIAE